MNAPANDSTASAASTRQFSRGGLVARQGLALPRSLATTAHLRALYPFSVEADLGDHGVFLGRNRLTGGAGFFFDLFEAYDAGLLQGPNAVICGAGAHGKSAIAKTLVHRSRLLRTASRDRFVAVIDPKGEWIPLATALGWAVLQLRPGGTTRINPLDAGPGRATRPFPDGAERHRSEGRGHDDVLGHQVAVTSTLLALGLGRPELTAAQQRLVSAVLAHLADAGSARRASRARDTRDDAASAAPTLVDVRNVLADPPAGLQDRLDTTRAELLERRRLLLDVVAMLLEHDLRGISDGPTTADLDWHATPGLVLDLSALLTNRKALRLVLTAAAGWLNTLMYSRPDLHKLNVIDEGWAALSDLAIVRYLQDQWRLGRQWGCGNVLITHALADLHSQADDGAAQNKIAEGLLNTTSVRVFLHQNPEHVTSLLADMGLTATEAGLLDQLPPFHALWKIGPHTAYVEHVIGPTEWAYCNTDTAMRGISAANTR